MAIFTSFSLGPVRAERQASRFIRHALTLAMASGSVAAYALDLSGAYQAALTQDANIRASRAAADSGRERLPQALSQLLPNMSASAVRNNNRLTSSTPNFLGDINTTQDAYVSQNQTIQVRQPLFRPYNTALYRQARAQVDDVNATLQRDLQNLVTRVAGAYFEALLAEDQFALIVQQKRVYETQLDSARKGLAAGSGIRTDIDDAQSRLDMAKSQELEARQNVEFTRRSLQAIINQPIDRLAVLDAQKLPLSPPSPDNVDDWVAMAEQQSPELVSLRAQVEAARQEVEKDRAGHLPTVDAIAQWSRSSSENLLSIHSRYDTKAVGVQVQIPIFSGGYVSSQVRQALADLERNEQNLESTRRDLGQRVHTQYRGVTEGIAKIRALNQALISADQLVLSSRKAYQAGSRTVVDVLNAEQQRMTTQRDLAQARYLFVLARIRLQSLVGTGGELVLEETNRWLGP